MCFKNQGSSRPFRVQQEAGDTTSRHKVIIFATAVVMSVHLICYAGPENIGAGSLVVFRHSKERVVLASDSRRVDKIGTHDDGRR
jgi:hypothetical protein